MEIMFYKVRKGGESMANFIASMLTFTAINILCWFIFCSEFTFKEKLEYALLTELILSLLTFVAYLFTGSK